MKELFEKWKNIFDFDAFIEDGIVCAQNYEKPHVLFVLRDMNCREKNKDLCEDLRNHGSGWKTWNNVGRWVKALLDGDTEYPYDMRNRKEELKRVAVMNLKKEGGGSRTNGAELEESVKAQRTLILEEIKLCDPDIIICCGLSARGIKANSTLLQEYIFGLEDDVCKTFESEELNREWSYFYADINNKSVPVISFAHPQATCLNGKRGHEDLFKPLYKDMLKIKEMFLKK